MSIIDHQKTTKLKNKQRKKKVRRTNKQVTTQINKRTNKETTKTKNTNKRCRLFCLVRCNGWSHCVRPNDTNKNATNKQPREPTQTHELKM